MEGVGGVLVPITPDCQVRDLIARLHLPAVVVGRAMLGGVNHALLTAEALRSRHIAILAIVLNVPHPSAEPCHNQIQEGSTVSLLHELSGVPVLGPLPFQADLQFSRGHQLASLAETPPIKQLADLVLGNSQSE